ncbi:MAG TPA: glycosyltransferase, partial [Nitrospira sp.]
YREAVAVIVPSINYEVSPPLVILEAFGQGTPVIVRHLGSMPEIIHESGGGCLFISEEELVAAMDQLVDDATFRQRLGFLGYQAYRSNRSEEMYFKKYFELIERVRSNRGRGFDDRPPVAADC